MQTVSAWKSHLFYIANANPNPAGPSTPQYGSYLIKSFTIYNKSSEFFKKIFTLAEVVNNIIFQRGLPASETKLFSVFQIQIFASFLGLRVFA